VNRTSGWDPITADAPRDWSVKFLAVGIAQSVLGGTAWEPTPWRAVQRAAWAAVNKEGMR
jgi:hypothetical protein